VEDYGGKAAASRSMSSPPIHQNKTDVGVGIARRWYDTESIDAIFDLRTRRLRWRSPISASRRTRSYWLRRRTALLTGEKCTPNTVHWTYDTYAYGRGLGKAVVAQGGKKMVFSDRRLRIRS